MGDLTLFIRESRPDRQPVAPHASSRPGCYTALKHVTLDGIDPEQTLMIEQITMDPTICHGKPCIRGLRYPVENVLEWLAGGMTIEDVLADYEDLTREDILAALAFAARMAHTKQVVNLAA